jgi:hypothetical protein
MLRIRTQAAPVYLVGAVLAATALWACTSTSAAPPDTMPQSATFIADMPESDGNTMALGIAVDDDQVTAYATNGVSDEAVFMGTQSNGTMNLMSPYQDQLTASFDGTNVNGTITMNEPAAQPHSFSATLVSAPAGMYMAGMGDSTATWIVKPNQAVVGMMMPNSKRDREVIDQINAQQQDFKDKVRQMRLERQMQPAPPLTFGTWQTTMNGTTMTAVPVTGGMTI